MFKLLFLPLNYGSVVQDGWYDAFREHGAALEIFDFMNESLQIKKQQQIRDSLLHKVRVVRPEVIFLQTQHTTIIDENTIRQIKSEFPNIKIINWTGDARDRVESSYKKIGCVVDLNLISSTGQLEMYRQQISRPVEYLQIGYNPKIYYPGPPIDGRFKWDATFIAHVNKKEQYPGTAEREKTVLLLRQTLGERFCLYGDGWHKKYKSKGSIEQKAASSAYKDSFCSISVNHFNDIEHYFSDRLLMCLASGRPVISYRFPNWETYFTNNCDLVIANSIDEIPHKVQWLKDNPDFADYIGKSGAAKVRAEHTYYSRVAELFSMIKAL